MKEEMLLLDKYFRAANYLSVCQLYLVDNPLLKEPLQRKHIKKKIVGHWGTVPAQNFIYTHLNRIIKKYDLDMIYISGPGHGGNFLTSNTYLEGTYSEVYPNIPENEEGLKKLFKQFSYPGGVSSHAAPEIPGTIHEGGELGYSLAHAYGAVLDNKDLIAACVVGDGEAETGPLSTAWNSNKFINPKTDGTVLPILNLNGYKISNPTIFGAMTNKELASYFYALGYKAYLVEGNEPNIMHQKMAQTMDKVIEDINNIKNEKETLWPMIILKTPKGWTCPKEVDGSIIEGSFKAHQVPISMEQENHISLLEKWLKSYKPEELFDINGKVKEEIKSIIPRKEKRLGNSPYTNGGILLKELIVPDFKKYQIKVNHGDIKTSDMLELSGFIRDIIKNNPNNFRVFSPDEMMSNRLYKVFETTKRDWQKEIKENDENLSKNGRVMDSYLSEHMCEGWLEGYLLTGRHGFFTSYEAFIRIIDSMVSQHAKWLKVSNEIPWRKEIASLNFLLTSHVWQQDHNGYTHQDPGFLDHMANKKADVVRMYLPPDTNCLLSCFDHCIKTKNYVNIIIASKHPSYQWLNMEEAINHCSKGIGIWDWASNDKDNNPDIVMACCGDTPTLETLAAISILRKELPDLKIRCVNVVDLMKLESPLKHPHALSNEEYELLFTKDRPIIFNYHGYPTLIHELTYLRKNRNISVHGYEEEGTITTPFDMRVQNKIDRFNLVIDVINHLENKGSKELYLMEKMKNNLIKHKEYIKENGEDLEEVREWKWESSEN